MTDNKPKPRPQADGSLTADDYIEQLPETVARAVNVWLSLSAAERTELKKATELFDSVSDSGRHQLHEIIINVHTGPYHTSCPYCGRG